MTNVLITGADGFIGSHLTEMLVKAGYNVRALSQYNSFNYWGWLEDVDCLSDIEVVTGDVRDPLYCKKITKDIDIVIHLAALIAIPYSYNAPYSYEETNVRGTLNICQAALENEVSLVVHTSTSEVYGTAKYVPIDEKHPLQPQSPYSASKISADAFAMSYYNSFDLPLVIARPFNTYGPRQSSRAVIPSIITQIASGIETISLGDLSPTRDLNYVIDTCYGFLKIINSENIQGEILNIGSGKEYSILNVLEMIKKIMKSNVEIVMDKSRIRPGKSEVYRLLCDNSKLKKLTDFVVNVDLQMGLEKTIEWFTNHDNLSKYKVNIYNV